MRLGETENVDERLAKDCGSQNVSALAAATDAKISWTSHVDGTILVRTRLRAAAVLIAPVSIQIPCQ
jgi:hypothetical protein